MTTQCCGNCGRGFANPDGTISCGAAVQDDALNDKTVNPVWAIRKYGIGTMLALLQGKVPSSEGTDCESLNRNDGATCGVWLTK